MNMRPLAQLIARSGVVAYCFALGTNGQAFARGMLPWGMVEDPATGSAAGSLGAYLVEHGRLKVGEALRIKQGVEMGRPSEIHVEINSERGRLTPKVSGSAVRVFEGHSKLDRAKNLRRGEPLRREAFIFISTSILVSTSPATIFSARRRACRSKTPALLLKKISSRVPGLRRSLLSAELCRT